MAISPVISKSSERHQNRYLSLIGLMAIIAVASAAIWGGGLYRAAIQEQRSWLEKMAESQAHLIEVVAKFDSEHSKSDHPEGAWGATMSQIKAASESYREFGETGEFVLGKLEDDKIVFLLKRRFEHNNLSKTVPFNSKLAEPMRLALTGKNGSIIGIDYRGTKVLAAYEPILGTGVALVAKIDLSEIKAPFIKVGTFGAVSAFLIVLIGVLLSNRITAPVIRELSSTINDLEKTQRITHFGNWEWDISRNILSWSDEIYRIFGIAPHQFEPTYEFFLASVHPDDKEKVNSAVQKSLMDKSPYNIDHRIILGDGTIRTVNEQGKVFSDLEGKPLRMLGIVRDITEAKRAEEMLRQAMRSTEAANNAKSEFLASMSHDLRTPLNSIMGFAQLMKDRTFGPLGHSNYDDYAGLIYDSGNLLVSLINDILDISKIEAGKFSLNKETVNPATLIETTLNMIAPQASVKGLALNQEFENDLPSLHADPRALSQVLGNMLSNAVKFTPEGGSITIEAGFANSGQLQIKVIDTGIGMSEQDIERAYRPFEQASGIYPHNQEGTGLGVHLSRNLMELHGGTLEIESQLGEGTTITLCFPKALIQKNT